MTQSSSAAETEVASASYLEQVGTTVSEHYAAAYHTLSSRHA
jgi:hypothetical protein